MRLSGPLLSCAVLLSTSLAAADALLPGTHGVKTYIYVEGQVPAGKVLVLANTFQGLDVVRPAQAAPVDWHPFSGQMRLVAVEGTPADKIEALRTSPQDRSAQKELLAKATPCSAPFDGIRTLPDDNPAVEARWVWSVAFEGPTCKATLLRVDYLDKTGAVSGSVPGTSAPAANAAPSPTAASTGTAATSATSSNAPAPGAAQPSGCGCSLPGDSPSRQPLSFAAALALAFAAALRRRRPAAP